MAADGTPRLLPRRRRFRLAVRVFFFSATLAIGAAYFFYCRFTDPAALVPLVQNYLQQFAHGAVRIEKASFSWLDGLHLYGVSVDEPAAELNGSGSIHDSTNAATNPAFSCREIAIRFEPWRLLIGDPRIESITLVRPRCLIVRSADEPTSDIAGLILKQPAALGDSRANRPAIELRDALFRFLHREAHSIREVDSLNVTIRGRPSARDQDIYELVWRGSAGDVTSGKAALNFRDGSLTNINGGLPWLSLEAVMIVINAQYDAAGTWSDLLGLQGRVRVRDYHITSVDGVVSPFAVVDLEHTALSIPMDAEERETPLAERYLRFDNVHGTIQLGRDAIRMAFDGEFDQASCRVIASLKTAAGRITSLNDVQFDATIDLSSLRLPEPGGSDAAAESRLFHRIPVLSRIHEEFAPRGTVDLSIDIGKLPGADQPFNLRGARLHVKQARAKYQRFPYELSNLSGDIDIDPSGVDIRMLCGVNGPAHVCINGSLDRPNRCAGGSLEIRGVDVTVDESLLAALPVSVRTPIDRFHPTGSVDVNVTMTRSGCRDGVPQPWQLETDILLRGVSAAYEALPIPVSQITGRIVVKGSEVTLHDLQGRTGTATIAAAGRILAGKDDEHSVDLTLTTRQLSLDEAFLEALPAEMAERLRPFHPTGMVHAKTRIYQDRNERALSFDSEIDLIGVSIDHASFPGALSDMEGRLRLTPSRLDIVHARGKLGAATLEAVGAVDLSRASLENMKIHARNVIIDEELRDSLAQDWGISLDPWSCDRLESVMIELRHPYAQGSTLAISGTAELRGSTIAHAQLRGALTEVDADLAFDAGAFEGVVRRARFHDAALSGRFRSDASSSTPLALQVNAQGLGLHDLMLLLPRETNRHPAHQDTVSASMNLHLEYRRMQQPGTDLYASSVSGTAALSDLNLPDVALESKGPTEIHFKGVKDSSTHAWRLFGKLNAERINYYGLPFSHLEGAWQASVNPTGEWTMSVTNLHGLLYDGDAIASVGYGHTADQRSYELAVMVRGVDIAPLAARWTNREASPRGIEVGGRLDAHLSLSGDLNDVTTRRGEGRIEVREGRLYRLPVLWAILQVINLNVAADDVLEEAETDFFVEGNRLFLEGINLRGTSIELFGYGTLSWPDQGIDLRLINTSPSLWDRVPVVGSAVRRVSRELLEFRVTGPIQQPTVRTTPLRGITDEIRSLFQSRRPRPIPSKR